MATPVKHAKAILEQRRTCVWGTTAADLTCLDWTPAPGPF